jgi:hypothetical protein
MRTRFERIDAQLSSATQFSPTTALFTRSRVDNFAPSDVTPSCGFEKRSFDFLAKPKSLWIRFNLRHSMHQQSPGDCKTSKLRHLRTVRMRRIAR